MGREESKITSMDDGRLFWLRLFYVVMVKELGFRPMHPNDYDYLYKVTFLQGTSLPWLYKMICLCCSIVVLIVQLVHF